MLLWLKIILKEFSPFFKNPNYRVFAILATPYGGIKRNMPGYMSITGKKLHITDNLSVMWQYCKIFFKRFYRFSPVNAAASYKGQEQHWHTILTSLAENNFRYYFIGGVSKPHTDIGSLDLQCNIRATRNN